MKIVKSLAMALCLLTVLAVPVLAQAPAGESNGGGQAKKSLYQRLGGYDAIAAVADDFIARLGGDKRFAKFFSARTQTSVSVSIWLSNCARRPAAPAFTWAVT